MDIYLTFFVFSEFAVFFLKTRGMRRIWRLFTTAIPIIEWLPQYKWKTYFPGDLSAALAISVIAVPQALAYGLMAGLPPVYGLYTSLLPVLIFSLLATSRHLNIGTFALSSLLIRVAILDVFQRVYAPFVDSQNVVTPPEHIAIGIALCLSCVCGALLVFLGVFRVCAIFSRLLLPAPLVAGYTTASAFYVATSQLKGISGIAIPANNGPGALFMTWFYFLEHLESIHLPTLLLAISNITLMLLLRFFNRWVQKRREQTFEETIETIDISPIGVSPSTRTETTVDTDLEQAPLRISTQRRNTNSSGCHKIQCRLFTVPDILVAVTLSTVLCATLGFYKPASEGGFGIPITGTVPSGLPQPIIPWSSEYLCLSSNQITSSKVSNASTPLTTRSEQDSLPQFCPSSSSLFLQLLLSSLPITFVIASMSTAISKTFAIKHTYLPFLRPNQDLVALGLASIFGCLLGQSYIACGSLSRTAVASDTGSTSQMTSLLSVFVVGIVVSFMTVPLEYIPTPTLSAVIIVAVMGLLWEIVEGKRLFVAYKKGERSLLDFALWTITVTSVLLLDVQWGLVAGLITCLIMRLYITVLPRLVEMGIDSREGEKVYKNLSRVRIFETPDPDAIHVFRVADDVYVLKIVAITLLQRYFIIEKCLRTFIKDRRLQSANVDSVLIVDLSHFTRPLDVDRLVTLSKSIASDQSKIQIKFVVPLSFTTHSSDDSNVSFSLDEAVSDIVDE